MTTNPKLNNFFQKAIDEMFKRVGFAGFDSDFAKQDGWYSKKSWTPEQRNQFRDWFITSARKDLRWSKRLAEREFAFFDFMWGWKDSTPDRGCLP
jgi:hypothetical protein